MSKSPSFNPQADADTYQGRAFWLAELGFASYADYLASPLWQTVRSKVLRKAKWRCCCCRGRATQVHHSRYHRNDLTGKNGKYLHAICGTCHQSAEFTWRSNKKTDVRQANSRLAYMSEKRSDGMGIMEKVKAVHSQLDAEFDAIFQ